MSRMQVVVLLIFVCWEQQTYKQPTTNKLTNKREQEQEQEQQYQQQQTQQPQQRQENSSIISYATSVTPKACAADL